MEIARDTYRLEDIAHDHPIGAIAFVPFAVERLRAEAGATEATLTVRLRDVSEAGETRQMLRLTWSAGSVPTQPMAVQHRIASAPPVAGHRPETSTAPWRFF